MVNVNSKFQTNIELEDLCKRLKIKLNGIYFKDELSHIYDGNYILNLDSVKNGNGGSHWVAFVKKGDLIIYCDSYGMPPPQNQINLFEQHGLRCYSNTVQIQDYKSTLCGYYCILFLYIVSNSKKLFLLRIEDYINLFTDDKLKLKSNDKRLVSELNKYL